jgi:hypothetical protein
MVALEKEWDLKFFVKPVYPIAVRLDGWFKNANPMWVPYLVRDVIREAQRHDTPFMWPRPDPIVMDLQTGEVPKHQPYIHRLTRLGVAAAERGRGLPFIYEVSSTLYSGRVQNWHEGTHLSKAAARAQTSKSWTPQSPKTPTATRPSLKRTKRPTAKRATGAYRPSPSTANPSSVKTASTRCYGGCSNTA